MNEIRQLPPLQELLRRRAILKLRKRLRPSILRELARECLEVERRELRGGVDLGRRYGSARITREVLLRHLETALLRAAEDLLAPRQRTVINASGVLLHTNLGRARLSQAAAAELHRAGTNAVAVEIDLESGRRDSRHRRIERWLQLLTGAEAAVVVNNGAAALWLAVEGLGARKRVLISRGEQVAIGGSFRMPELLRQTRAKLVEVGTTNKTTLRDYRGELRPGDLLLKVHPGNYRVEGFVESVPPRNLAALCDEVGASFVFDAGSGSLYNFGAFGLSGEPTVAELLRDGAHLVTFSGDKLLGGPQAGLIVGRKDLVERLAKHPLQRALRCDKLVLAALEATLAAYGATEGRPDLPLLEILGTPLARLRARARSIVADLAPLLPNGWRCEIVRSDAAMGGGSFAGTTVPSIALRFVAPTDRAARRMHEELRRGSPAILTRVSDGAVLFDLRCVAESELGPASQRLQQLLGTEGGSG